MKRYSARYIMALTLTVLLGMGTFLSGLQAATQKINLVVAVDFDSMSSLDGDSGATPMCGACFSPCGTGCFAGVLPETVMVPGAHATELIYMEAPEAYQRQLQPDPLPPKDLIVA